MTYEEMLDLPMQENDSGATSIRGYFHALLTALYDEEEGFSGKRPFGNSGWTRDLAKPLILAEVIPGSLDEEGYLEEVDEEALNSAVFSMIDALCGVLPTSQE